MTDLMAGEIVAALLLLVGVITLIALQGKDNPGPDVGVDIVDCGMVHDCDGCDECGAPMVIEAPGLELAYYGTPARLVHQHCLDARRDATTVCTLCAQVLEDVTTP